MSEDAPAGGSRALHAVAGAPYFNLNGQDGQANLTLDQVLAAMSASIDQVSQSYGQYAHLATYYGLKDRGHLKPGHRARTAWRSSRPARPPADR